MTGLLRQGKTHLLEALPRAADRVASRFPLVCRPRLTCPDLETRIAEVRAYADAASAQAEPADRLHRACAAWNLAALIAADRGRPDLAADLCERQLHLFQTAWPVSGRAAIACLQPLVNLARLTHRAGDPEGACRELHALDRAVHRGGTAAVHGRAYSFDGFTETEQDRREVLSWLRVVLLEDGTRLLATAGRWAKAAAHAALYGDTAERLHAGRQAQVIAHLHDGRPDSALALVDTSVITAPGERAVAACLRGYSDLRTDRLTPEGVTAMLASVRPALRASDPDTVLFRTRLGLTAVDLAAERCQAQADLLCAELIREASESGDAFAARQVLGHAAARGRMTPTQARALTTLVHRAGLGRGAMPQPLLTALTAAVESAGTALNMRQYTPHDLRHAWATVTLSNGIALHEVSRWMGHRSVRVTADRYGHLTADGSERCRRVLGAVFGGVGSADAERAESAVLTRC